MGFTHRKGALTRWLITRHVTREYAEAMNGCCDGVAHAQKSHKEHGAALMDRDESRVGVSQNLRASAARLYSAGSSKM